MTLDINNQNKVFLNHCDYGANRILKTQGSLLGYIQTGDYFDSKYNVGNSYSEGSLKKKLSNAFVYGACLLSGCCLVSKIGIKKVLSLFKKT